MSIRHIFEFKPLAALAVLMCMATIIALFRLNRQRRSKTRSDQFLIGFLGLLAIYEALKLLKDTGVFVLTTSSMLDDAIELMVASSCLVAAFLLRLSRINHLEQESAMRLARAAPPRSSKPDVAAKDTTTLETLSWAVPRVSDGAFKLLAVLCIRSEIACGRVPVGVVDAQLKLGKNKEDLDRYLKELEEAGAVTSHRHDGTVDIEIVTAARRSGPPMEQLALTQSQT